LAAEGNSISGLAQELDRPITTVQTKKPDSMPAVYQIVTAGIDGRLEVFDKHNMTTLESPTQKFCSTDNV
jgi:hypothetical protein